MALVTDLLSHLPWPNYSNLRWGFVVYWYRTKNEVRRTITASGWKQDFSKKCIWRVATWVFWNVPFTTWNRKTSWQKEKEAEAYTQMLQARATEAQGPGKSFLDPNWIKQFYITNSGRKWKARFEAETKEAIEIEKSQVWCGGQENYWN